MGRMELSFGELGRKAFLLLLATQLFIIQAVPTSFFSQRVFAETILTEQRIIFSEGQDVVVIDPDGGNRQVLGQGYHPQISPDGTKVVFCAATPSSSGNFNIHVMDIDGGNITNLTPGTAINYRARWSPDGSKIIFTGGRDINGSGVFGAFTMNPDGSDVSLLVQGAGNASFSPAGDKIVYDAIPQPPAASSTKVWVANADGSNRIPVTPPDPGPSVYYDGEPEWSPDGSKIVFRSSRGTPSGGIYTINPDGSGRQLVTASLENGHIGSWPTWSPDSQTILYTQRISPVSGTAFYNLYKVPVGGGEQLLFYEAQQNVTAPSWWTPDTLSPALQGISWSHNPKSVTQTSTLTVGATDSLSGVGGGEYFIGDTDPGEGNGATMNWDGVNLSTTFGTDFPIGVYKVNVRAQDNAGNWSEVASDYLVVYDPGFRMTGRRTIVPSLSNGDVLPGLIDSSQDDKATFAFSVKYDNSGQVSGNSDLKFKYDTGTCKGNNPQNCHSLELDATSIAWFFTQSANSSEGVFQGMANLEVDGVSSTVVFRVTGLDGERLNPTSLDHFTLLIYAAGANPDTDSPIYQVSADVDRGNIKIVN